VKKFYLITILLYEICIRSLRKIMSVLQIKNFIAKRCVQLNIIKEKLIPITR
jgi:hypothetical protein